MLDIEPILFIFKGYVVELYPQKCSIVIYLGPVVCKTLGGIIPLTFASALIIHWGFPDVSAGKNLSARQETQEIKVQSQGQEDTLEEENDNLLQYSCLKNTKERETWWAKVQRVAKSDTAE